MSQIPSVAPGGINAPSFDPLFGWDSCWLNGEPLPGKSRIVGCHLALKLDKKKMSATDGSNPVFHGINPHTFFLDCVVWTDDDLEKLRKISAKYQPSTKQQPIPVDISHPQIMHLDQIVNVVVSGVSQFDFVPELGVMGRKIRFDLHHSLPTKGVTKKKVIDKKQVVASERENAAYGGNALPEKQAGIASAPGPTGAIPGA